jgi:cell division protein FtsW (lipid II flippase)
LAHELAIASGMVFGVGAGKSSMKNILPQSTSESPISA